MIESTFQQVFQLPSDIFGRKIKYVTNISTIFLPKMVFGIYVDFYSMVKYVVTNISK